VRLERLVFGVVIPSEVRLERLVFGVVIPSEARLERLVSDWCHPERSAAGEARL
jgi:hypothetical protein